MTTPMSENRTVATTTELDCRLTIADAALRYYDGRMTTEGVEWIEAWRELLDEWSRPWLHAQEL